MYNALALIGQSLYMTREYKCLKEGNILVNPPLLPRPRWDINIYIICLYVAGLFTEFTIKGINNMAHLREKYRTLA